MVDVTLQTGSNVESGGEMTEQAAVGEVRQRPAIVRAAAWVASRYGWVLVIVGLVGVYLVINLVLPNVSRDILSGFTRVYVAQPAMWLLLIGGVLAASRYGATGKLTFTKSLLWMALLIGRLPGVGYGPRRPLHHAPA